MTRRPLLAIAALASLLVLTACEPPGPSEPGGPVDDSPAPGPATPTPVGTDLAYDVLDEDSVLFVIAGMTASNGATADVIMVAQKPTDWNDPAAADRPALMSQVCAGYLDESVYEAANYSFSLVKVHFVPLEGEWPAGEGVHLVPDAEYLIVASNGDVVDLPGFDPQSPPCDRDKYIAGPGYGEMVFAFRDDIGVYEKWRNHPYGFATYLAPSEFTSCWYVATPLGKELGFRDPSDFVDETDICKAGYFLETEDS